jgi:hypothetical protein
MWLIGYSLVGAKEASKGCREALYLILYGGN